jgi:hypothetical protein
MLAVLTTTLPLKGDAVDLNLGVRASLGLDATVGLDKSTRDFIAGLPSQVREQVMQLLKDALPLIDTSVDKYLTKVDDILNRQIDHLQCSIVGVGTTLGAELKQAITLGAIKPQPYGQLIEDWKQTSKDFYYGDNPHRYRAAYTDFLYRAQVTYCQTSMSAETAQGVAELQAQARPKWGLWLRLEGQCANAEQCFDSTLAQTSKLIGASNPLDRSSVGAPARIAQVVRPSPPSWLAQLINSKFDPAEYETQLRALLSIQDALAVAAKARENVASELVVAAKKLMTNLDQEVRVAQAGLQPYKTLPCMHVVSQEMVNQARPHADVAAANAADIDKALTQAVNLDIKTKQEADKVRQDLASKRETITGLQNAKPYSYKEPTNCPLHFS